MSCSTWSSESNSEIDATTVLTGVEVESGVVATLRADIVELALEPFVVGTSVPGVGRGVPTGGVAMRAIGNVFVSATGAAGAAGTRGGRPPIGVGRPTGSDADVAGVESEAGGVPGLTRLGICAGGRGDVGPTVGNGAFGDGGTVGARRVPNHRGRDHGRNHGHARLEGGRRHDNRHGRRWRRGLVASALGGRLRRRVEERRRCNEPLGVGESSSDSG